jgi:hypothetical protein
MVLEATSRNNLVETTMEDSWFIGPLSNVPALLELCNFGGGFDQSLQPVAASD